MATTAPKERSLRATLRLPNAPEIKDPAFYVLLESHLAYLRSQEITTRSVPLDVGLVYAGDFHGLLQTLGVEKSQYYLVTRINGLRCSQDYDGRKIPNGINRDSDTGEYAVIIPNSTRVDEMTSTFTSTFA